MSSYSSEETHDVKIENVKPLEKRLNVVFKVTGKNDEREINKRTGETHRVCDFTVADETGIITLTLWNEDIDAMKEELVYKLSNGFANVFQNSLRLSKGKFGNIAEDSTVFEDINSENDRSAAHVDDPRRQSYGNRGGGYESRQSYGSDRSSGGLGNQRSNRRARW
jgi:replication factor A1